MNQQEILITARQKISDPKSWVKHSGNGKDFFCLATSVWTTASKVYPASKGLVHEDMYSVVCDNLKNLLQQIIKERYPELKEEREKGLIPTLMIYPKLLIPTF